MFEVRAAKCEWARRDAGADFNEYARSFYGNHLIHHWSRVFEYPWVLYHLNHGQPGMWVLDAAGGDGLLQHCLVREGLQVVNVDMDAAKQPQSAYAILPVPGDLLRLTWFRDGVFDRVTCVSVLEHTDRPAAILKELWRVLRPGGRLLVTLDVASYSRHNHTIDLQGAKNLLRPFGLHLQAPEEGALTASFDELDPKPHEPKFVNLHVLCFWADKPE